jgi:hypothetical protein
MQGWHIHAHQEAYRIDDKEIKMKKSGMAAPAPHS